jgi:interferon gamma-inducible protein 30
MANAPKVKVDFYMEALCPGCQYFSTHVLAPVLREPGIGELVDLNIVPAGNANLKWSDAEGKMKLTCQHGKEECEGNRILACLTNKHRNERGFVKAVDCIEKGDSGFRVSETFSSAIDYISNVTAHKPSHTRMGRLAEACMKEAGIKSEPIFACSDGSHGEELAQQSVNATSSLVPKLEYAPWVVVNGVPLKEDAYSFKEHVCKAWKGVPPKECDKALLKDYFPRSQTLRGGASKGAATKGQSKRGDAHEAGLKGHKQLLAAWQGGALFQKCLPDHF